MANLLALYTSPSLIPAPSPKLTLNWVLTALCPMLVVNYQNELLYAEEEFTSRVSWGLLQWGWDCFSALPPEPYHHGSFLHRRCGNWSLNVPMSLWPLRFQYQEEVTDWLTWSSSSCSHCQDVGRSSVQAPDHHGGGSLLCVYRKRTPSRGSGAQYLPW